MEKNKKTFRAVSFIVALVMIACIAPTVAFAENTVSVPKVTVNFTDGQPTVTAIGTITSDATLTMLAVRSDEPLTDLSTFTSDEALENALMYIDQYKTDSTGTKTWNFSLRDSEASGDYITVFMGGTDAAMQHASASLLQDAPTGLVFGEDSYPVGTPVEIPCTDTAWISKVSKVTVNGTEVTGLVKDDTAGKITFTLTKGTYTDVAVVVTADGYKDATFTGSVSVVNKAAGTATLVAPGGERNYYIYGVDTIGLNLTDSTPAGWSTDVAVSVVDAENEAAGTYADGVITLTAVPTTKTAYTVKFAATDYEAVADLTFTTVAPTGDVTPAEVTYDYAEKENSQLADKNNFFVTIPANYTDAVTGATVTYTATVDGETLTFTGGEATSIARPAYGEAAKAIVVKATITKEGFTNVETESLSTSIPAVAEAPAPAIEAENVQLIGSNVYGKTGMKVVIVTPAAGVVDNTTQSITVGDAPLYYVEARGYYVGITSCQTAAEVIENLTIDKTVASDFIVYGKAGASPNYTAALNTFDFAAVKKLALNKVADATDKMYLAADVASGAMNGVINTFDFAAVKKAALSESKQLAIATAK